MTLTLACPCGEVCGQTTATETKPFAAGAPLGVSVEGVTTPMSSNVKVFGSINNAESCVYGKDRGLILAVNRGAAQTQVPDDAYTSLVNHDGSVHTAKSIGATRDGLVLNPVRQRHRRWHALRRGSRWRHFRRRSERLGPSDVRYEDRRAEGRG